jgi:hypothetical protein
MAIELAVTVAHECLFHEHSTIRRAAFDFATTWLKLSISAT